MQHIVVVAVGILVVDVEVLAAVVVGIYTCTQSVC